MTGMQITDESGCSSGFDLGDASPLRQTLLAEELDQRKMLSLVAASQASNALADLMRFATEGPALSGFTFNEDVVELLLDAAKISIMVTKDPQDEEILVAINERLEGWV